MRTTISLYDRLAEAAKKRAAEAGTSVIADIAAVLHDAIAPFYVNPSRRGSLGAPVPCPGSQHWESDSRGLIN